MGHGRSLEEFPADRAVERGGARNDCCWGWGQGRPWRDTGGRGLRAISETEPVLQRARLSTWRQAKTCTVVLGECSIWHW